MIKCITKNCQNHEHQDHGVTLKADESDEPQWICMPCWLFLTQGDKACSQIYRNAVDIAQKTDLLVPMLSVKKALRASYDDLMLKIQEERDKAAREGVFLITSQQKSNQH